MKISEADILLVPGYGDTPDGHWMRRWEAKMANARVVEQKNWFQPELKPWRDTLKEAIDACSRPVVLVGHSLGCLLIAHDSLHWPKDKVKGVYMVAPPDLERSTDKPAFNTASFLPLPLHPIQPRTHVVASRTDPYCAYEKAEHFAKEWSATFQDAGAAGHINMESGHGPWPEGMMSFALFMKRLSTGNAY